MPPRCKDYPDEKGTERAIFLEQPKSPVAGCKDYPDEKGTERGFWARGSAFERRCKDYPDEKGTERAESPALFLLHLADARITPMKRGLKVLFLILCGFGTAMQGLPR